MQWGRARLIRQRGRSGLAWLTLGLAALLFTFAMRAGDDGPAGADWIGAGEIGLTILSTTDIHAHVGGGRNDWLRLATLVKREREAAGGRKYALLIDSGDTMQGDLIGAVSRGEVARLLLEHLEYDAWVPGNHDLDFGTARLAEVCRDLRIPVLNGNLTLDGQTLSAWRMEERAGIKVAIIGMNAWYLDQWLWGEAMGGYRIARAVDTLKRVLPDVAAAGPDVIVLAIHQGWSGHDAREINEVAEIARMFPQIAVILGGHTHIGVGGKSLSGVWYVQAGAHATDLGRVRLVFDATSHKLRRITSELVSAYGLPLDPAATAAVQPWLDQAAAFAATTVVEQVPVRITSTGMPGRSNRLSELICRAIAADTGAEVVLQGTHSRVDWTAGRRLTEGDVFAAIPYENYLGVCELDAAALTAILDEQWASIKSVYANGVWGVVADVRGGRVVGLLDAVGQPVPPERRFKVALHSYLLSGAGGRYPVLRARATAPESNLVDTGRLTRDALRRYLAGTPDWSPPVVWWRVAPGAAGAATSSAKPAVAPSAAPSAVATSPTLDAESPDAAEADDPALFTTP